MIFMPYLFGITYEGSQFVPEKFILIPCLHDEPFARLAITLGMFKRARFIFFNTQPEFELAQRLYGVNGDNSRLVALGFDESPPAHPEVFRAKYGFGNDPYFIFVGRWEKGKNVHLLVEYFKNYLINTGRKVKLVLLGSGDLEVSEDFRKDILPLGFIPLEDKRDAIAGAVALFQPSVNESLSIVIMEAWSLKTPVLVHGNCVVTKHHCTTSGGGLYFSNYFEFEETVNFILNHESSARQMGQLGYRYVRENYSWQKVLDRFEKAFEEYLLSNQKPATTHN
jgi:glycosyltransferase involved in cell wall biosynthesis